MLKELLIGSGVIFVSIVVQALFVAIALTALKRWVAWVGRGARVLKTAVVAGAIGLWLMAAQGVAIVIWSLLFSGLGVFADFDTSLYFAAVAFTTLGFGDVIPPQEWRHLAGLCAANGLLVFGVSAAVLVEMVRQLYGSLSLSD